VPGGSTDVVIASGTHGPGLRTGASSPIRVAHPPAGGSGAGHGLQAPEQAAGIGSRDVLDMLLGCGPAPVRGRAAHDG